MGYMRHHAIIVTCGYDDWIGKAHKKATQIFVEVSGILKSSINGYESFFIPPDGSKEGWEESEIGDTQRKEYVKWLIAQKYDDGSSPLKWVEVQYGDDEGETIITQHSDT